MGNGRVERAPVSGGLDKVTTALFALLVVSRLVMVVPSFADLLSGRGGVDLQARRAELEWVMHGVSPHLALERIRIERQQLRSSQSDGGLPVRGAEAASELDVPSMQDISVGRFAGGNFETVNTALAAYPHWSYPLYAALVWPSWPATATFYAGLLLCCMVGFCWWATRLFEGIWRWLALLVCLLPMPSWSVAVFTGQFSIPLVLLLAAFSLALERGRWRTAGLLLGFAAMKPTFCALFGFALLAPAAAGRAKWRGPAEAAAVAATIVIGSSLLVWWRTGIDPWAGLLDLLEGNVATASMGYGLMPLVGRMGISAGVLTAAFALAGAGIALLVPWVLRRYSMLCQFAVFGLLSRLWAYHRHYDDLLLLFLLLALLVEVKRGSRLALGALLCMALTLASPVPTSSLQEAWRVGVWVLSTAVLLWEARALSESGGEVMAIRQRD